MNERVTVELDAETLKRAREAGMDLSHVLRRALHQMLPPLTDDERKRAAQQCPLTDDERKRAAQQWYEDNKEAVDASNEYVGKHGLWSDGLRMF